MTDNNLDPQVETPKTGLLATGSADKRLQIRQMNDEWLLTADQLEELKIIYPGCKDEQSLNDYRELRTKLLHASNNQNFVCMVSGIRAKAGASHVAMNLAATIALDHSKTALIIDCNSYTPSLHNYLQDDKYLGLSNFLEEDIDEIEDIIHPIGIRRIRVIPSGVRTEYAAENFSSEKMKLFIEKVKLRYPDRFIILDTPPVGLYVESQILASICDMAILVVPYAAATATQVQTSIDLISSDKLMGIVLNNK
ncbi:polysaccharide biosynthesis protein [Psychromonas sp. PT13]|uniref:polysaccharide biosynthesis protein n=1 Tax=Psychromonas sp. PT13 TaxID=3439547 RepID=UPI003EC132C7